MRKRRHSGRVREDVIRNPSERQIKVNMDSGVRQNDAQRRHSGRVREDAIRNIRNPFLTSLT
jgi:hypothetical protein